MGEQQLGEVAVRPSRRMGPSLIPSAFGVALGLVYSYGATNYQVGTLSAPGPGMFPLFVGLVILVPSLWCLIDELRKPSAPPEGIGEAFWRVPSIAAGIAAYVFLLKPLGFLFTSILLTFSLLLIMGRRPWWVALIIAVVSGAIAYYGFSYLNVPLPAGILG